MQRVAWRGQVAALALAALVWQVAPAAVRAGTTVWTYPGCDGAPTLQDCVDKAAVDDVVEIATDTPIVDPLSVEKGLTVRAASGFTPEVGGLSLLVPDGQTVVIGGIRFTHHVDVDIFSGSGQNVVLDRISAIGANSSSALVVAVNVPSRVSVTRSRFSGASGVDQVYLSSGSSGHVALRLVGNRIQARGLADSGGGISLIMQGSGSTRADIMNNVIWDIGRCECGGASGLAIYANDTQEADVNVVGNTFHVGTFFALYVDNRLDAGGHIAVDAFDNIMSRQGHAGINLASSEPSRLSFRAGYNDYYGNDGANILEGHSAGPGNLKLSPGFVSASSGDLRLSSSSPLIDRGLTCSPGGVAMPDASGNHRLAGRSVDMGAHERGAGSPSGRILVGSGGANTLTGGAGRDILCGLGGDDTLSGLGGRDYLDGGSGPDLVIGGGGPDRLLGGSGDDTLCARDGSGTDVLDGGRGTDGYRADAGDARTSVEHLGTCP